MLIDVGDVEVEDRGACTAEPPFVWRYVDRNSDFVLSTSACKMKMMSLLLGLGKRGETFSGRIKNNGTTNQRLLGQIWTPAQPASHDTNWAIFGRPIHQRKRKFSSRDKSTSVKDMPSLEAHLLSPPLNL